VVRVVTVSATYGAGGSIIAPRLAERLGLAFVDRVVVASTNPTPEAMMERLSTEERLYQPSGALASGLAQATPGLGVGVPADLTPHERIRHLAEAAIGQVSESGGVVLGRAAAAVLADAPHAYHIRLDGPPERRIERAMTIEGIDHATAKARQSETDKARARYVSRLYGLDASDPRLYHIVVDTTVLSADDAVELLVTAVTGFFRTAPA
jgi:cytidylate kinase